jgi:hypothetical protein
MFAAAIKDTTQYDRLYNVKADLPFIRHTTIATGVVSFVSFQHFIYNMSGRGFSLVAVAKYAAKDPQFLGIQLGGMFWMMLLFGDMKSAKMIEQHWAIVFV